MPDYEGRKQLLVENGKCSYCGSAQQDTPPQNQPQQQQQTYTPPPNFNQQPNPAYVQQPVYLNVQQQYVKPVSTKSKTVAGLLCFFLGYFGAHHFYVGKIGMGILYLFTAGFFMIGVLVDLIKILTNTFKDSSGLPLLQ